MSILLNEEDLVLIQKLELKIASEIKRICDKYDIQYSIFFGTLLGAVRHGGFIPWDDDMDIVMLRAEYEKFIIAAEHELDDCFMIVDYEHCAESGEPFTKIMLRDAIMVEKFAQYSDVPHYVFVDIFPYDGIPNSLLLKQLQRFQNYQLKKRILIKSNYNFEKYGIKKIIYNILKLTTGIKKQNLILKYRKNEKRYSANNAKYVITGGCRGGYKKNALPKKWFDNYTHLNFEGIEFSAIANYEEFLKHYYGDYMELPPVEERVNRHMLVKLDLSKFGGRCLS